MAAVAKVRRTQEARSTATRKLLLNATVECLFELGYARTTTIEIAERAGVSRGAQLHHFPRKEELVIKAVEHLFTLRLGEFRDAFRKLPEGIDRRAAAVDLIWSMFKGPTFYAWLELVVASRTDSNLRQAVRAITERFGEEVRKINRELFEPGAASEQQFEIAPSFLFALMEGLALEKILSDSDEIELVLKFVKEIGNFLFPQNRTQETR